MKSVVRVGKKYQIVIPKKIREQVGLKIEDELVMSVRNSWIVIQPRPKRYGDYMQGLGKQMWKGLDAIQYVRKEREAWKE